MEYTFCVPCLFGLEGIVADELKALDMRDVAAENGRVLFAGDLRDMVRANLWLRTGERILLRLASFDARSFDDLFEGVKAIQWEEFIPKDGAFPVAGHALNSALMSVPDCQKIIKKAAASRLGAAYKTDWMPETGEKHQLRFSIMRDRADIFLDTTGTALHKRGYRPVSNDAPIRETLASAMVQLARYDGFRPLYDPMCGSGTIVIEAAMIAANMAPGMVRRFDAERWHFVPAALWEEEREKAQAAVREVKAPIYAGDLDPSLVTLSQENARRAGVSHLIRFAQGDMLTADYTECIGTLITNPPYGERLLDLKAARALYQAMGRQLLKAPRLKKYIISSDAEFETHFGRKADKRRKLYNGMIPCTLYMYFHGRGEKKA